jgi:hypothetical protein
VLRKLLLDRLTVAKLLAGSVLGGAGNRAVVAPTGTTRPNGIVVLDYTFKIAA